MKAGRGIVTALRRVVAVLALLSAAAVLTNARADDGTPKRLFARPEGVVTTAPVKPGTAAPTGDFTLGYQPAVKVTGAPPINADAAFVMKVRDKWPNCDLQRVCGDLAYVDCGSAVDGPAYYINAALDVVATCGGACMNPAEPCNCPPDGWTCN
jgi:hypothetical protein